MVVGIHIGGMIGDFDGKLVVVIRLDFGQLIRWVRGALGRNFLGFLFFQNSQVISLKMWEYGGKEYKNGGLSAKARCLNGKGPNLMTYITF